MDALGTVRRVSKSVAEEYRTFTVVAKRKLRRLQKKGKSIESAIVPTSIGGLRP